MRVNIKKQRKTPVAKIIGALSPEMVKDLVDYSWRYWRRKVPIGPPRLGQHTRTGIWPSGKPGQYKKSITRDYKEGSLFGRIFTEDPGAPSTEYGTKSHGAQPAFRPAKIAGNKRIRTLIKKIIKKIREQSVG